MFHAQRWTLDKIRARLELIAPLVYRQSEALPAFHFTRLESPVSEPPVAVDVDDTNWDVIRPFDYWGTWFTDFVLRTRFSVPAGWDPALAVALYLPIGEAGDFSHPEALAYIDGKPYAACDRHHQEIGLDDSWRGGESHVLALHGWTGLGGFANGEMMSKLFMRPCQVVQIDQPTRDFIALARVARDTAENLDAAHPARARLLNALDDAFTILETRDPLGESFYASVAPAMAALKAGLEKAGDPQDVVIHATGHAHIDVAWLWTLGQTHRKSERTFQNALRLMKQFPDYHFSQSQPQLYEFIRQDQPELFEGIRQKVAEGRWEPMGGMWVEADCNLSGAESLARQFLLGRSYFRKYFGKDAESPLLWLPDVFGYAWALPQLIKQAGLKYFMTIKIGWSQYNRLPYDTFMWQGIDGTQILTHFSTVKEFGSPFASTYNAMANAKEALGTWANFQQKELHKDLLMAYGFGDGGGGPTREMLENIETMGSMPGLPQVKQSSVRKFFESIEPTESDRRMPVWNGELYLEYHRGTYTTQARNKRANRKSEFLMHDSEFLAVYAALLDPNYIYPAPEFTQAWQTICLNQFHDIIPGSSIGLVYEESLAQYAQLGKDVTEAKDGALRSLAAKLGGDVLLANPAPFARRDLAFVPGETTGGFQLNGKALETQAVEGGLLVDAGELAPYSVTTLTAVPGGSATEPAVKAGNAHVLENDLLRVEFNQGGDITRVYDKAVGREMLPAGAVANQLQAFEDRPKDFDAWDIDIYYDDKTYLAEPAATFKVVEAGPLRRMIEIKRRILNSEVTQRVSLRRNSARVDFDTTVDWKERHIMLKVAFPVDLLAPQATYEIQWGNVQRPTHHNTSWDWARFETCAHKWVDLSEGDYGVSLLNDCKYGHDIRDNVMRITLLRSPTMPDPAADLGTHQFVYSLYPHSGGWDERTQAEAYALNDPIIVYRAEKAGTAKKAGLEPLVSVSSPNLVVETIKQAEDGDGMIVRLYESHRSRGKAALRFAFPVQSAWETNLLEENERKLETAGNEVRFDVRPFQILTVRVKRG